MPGGYGNIDGKVDGKQFSSEYQPAEKWTEVKALELGNALIEWMRADPVNMFFEEYFYLVRDDHPGLISYLANKFTSFSILLVKAKHIQELKLKKYGVADKLNASITKFVLINEHDWRDKKEITGKDGQPFMPAKVLTKEEARHLWDNLEDGNFPKV